MILVISNDWFDVFIFKNIKISITMADYQRVLEGGVLNGVPPPAESLRWMLTQTERS